MENLLETLIVAEFDIDKGAVVKECYPKPLDDVDSSFLAEHMLPDGVHNRDEDWTFFFLHIPDLHYVLSYCKTTKSKELRRGASVAALAIVSKRPFCHVFRPFLKSALCKIPFPDGTQELLRQLYESIAQTTWNREVNLPSELRMKVWRWVLEDRKRLFVKGTVDWDSRPLEISAPLYAEEGEVLDPRVSLVKLVKTFKKYTVHIAQAILLERRLLFYGAQTSASEVCGFVLSAMKLLPPEAQNKLTSRVFPYCSLIDTEFVETKGYIAGVTNPVFQQHSSWWDILCVVDDGTVLFSSGFLEKEEEDVYLAERGNTISPMDEAFINDVLANISVFSAKTSHFQRAEDWIQIAFRDYLRTILDLSCGDEVFPSEKGMQKAYEYYTTLMAQCRQSDTYKRYRDTRVVNNMHKSARRFRLASEEDPLMENDIIAILQSLLKSCRDENDLLEFLSLFPACRGGLESLSPCMFHPSEAVRLTLVALLRRLDDIPEGKECISRMNMFFLLSYGRNSRLLPDTKQ